MKPTAYFRWYVYPLGDNEEHPVATVRYGNKGQVLQQWWHFNDEPPPSSNGEWRDIPQEFKP